MNDILFGNNNQGAIKRLAKRNYRANKQRNFFVTVALFLTAFMITSVFSLGCSYFETFQMQQIRAMGTTADVAITNLTKSQYEELRRSSLVSVVGVSQRLGSVDTSGMDDALLSISWIDEAEWKEHRVPTISDLHGNYPQAENELMLPTWALSAMGISDPQVGMNIPVSYQLGTDYQYLSGEFVLSGYYTDYSTSRVGNRGSAYVSELFATQTGLSFESVSTAMISFSDDSNVERSCEKLKSEIIFTEGQSFEIVPSVQSNSVSIILPLAATDTPYLTVRRAWHTEHNRPVILEELKTKAAERNIPLPVCLAECLKAAKATSTSEYVVSNRDGEPLSYTQFKRLWQYIVTRTVKERSYYRYEDGKRVKHTVTPVLGEKAAHNGKVVYSLDFEVTPHQLRHTYITNLIHASVDPKTVQYLAGHESSKITMDIYAKVKYNRPDELVRSMSGAFAGWEAV